MIHPLAFSFVSIFARSETHREVGESSSFRTLLTLTGASLLIGQASAKEENDPKLSNEQVAELIKILETKRSPNVYGAVYYPNWKDPKDGLKSVTVEAIAEHASARIQREKVKLEVASEPIASGSAGAVLLKRGGGGLKPGIFAVYLYHDPRNGWGFLSLPIPPKGGLALDPDTRFTKAALDDETPYDGRLYEFDDATKRAFEALAKRLDSLKPQVDGKG